MSRVARLISSIVIHRRAAEEEEEGRWLLPRSRPGVFTVAEQQSRQYRVDYTRHRPAAHRPTAIGRFSPSDLLR